MRRACTWLITLVVTLALTCVTTRQALTRYQELHSGWSWDLAYYNQWFWALTYGDQVMSIRPIGPLGQEGPSVWKMNYLAPVRAAILPAYLLHSDPTTLLVVQNVVIWWCVPALFSLVRSESKSYGLALSAALLVPLTPLLWPLVHNDFRELQLALPFIAWAVQGVRTRSILVATVGVVGAIACRQELAVLTASLAFLPPRESEDVGQTWRWSRVLVMTGISWLLFGYLGYERWISGEEFIMNFFKEILNNGAGFESRIKESLALLVLGLGSWAVLTCLAPRSALLILPWAWIFTGRWGMWLLGTHSWTGVRYVAPMVGIGLAVGCIGYARLGLWLMKRRYGVAWLTLAWIAIAGGLIAARQTCEALSAREARLISKAEAAEIWRWIDRVKPDDAVLSTYEVSAPLSSRRWLYGYEMTSNAPPSFPALAPEFRWAFVRNVDFDPSLFQDQGFERVHHGKFLSVWHREFFVGDVASLDRRSSAQRSFTASDYLSWFYATVLLDALPNSPGVLIAIGPPLILSIGALRRTRRVRRASTNTFSFTGEQLATDILTSAEISGISLVKEDAKPTNLYESSRRTVRLSQTVVEGRSASALALGTIAAGTALLSEDRPRATAMLIPLTMVSRLGAGVAWLAIAAGIVLFQRRIVMLGAALYWVAVLAALLPVLIGRKAANRSASVMARSGLIDPEQAQKLDEATLAMVLLPLAETLPVPTDVD